LPFDKAIEASANLDFLYLESAWDDMTLSFDCLLEDGDRAIIALQEEGQVATIICK